VPLTNMHRGEILDAAVLPIRTTAYTPCFRSEADRMVRTSRPDPAASVRQGRAREGTTPDQSYDELEP